MEQPWWSVVLSLRESFVVKVKFLESSLCCRLVGRTVRGVGHMLYSRFTSG